MAIPPSGSGGVSGGPNPAPNTGTNKKTPPSQSPPPGYEWKWVGGSQGWSLSEITSGPGAVGPNNPPSQAAPPGYTWQWVGGTQGWNLVPMSEQQTTAPNTPAPVEVEYNPVVTGATEYLDSLISSTLGVSGLGAWASNLYMKGASALEIIQALRYGADKSPEGQAAYQKYLSAFPGMDEFLRDGTFSGEAPEMQYISYRNAVKEAAARYGINAELTSSQKIYTYLKNKVSASEIAERMSTAASAVATTPPETLTILNEYYGVGSSDLISFFLDTDETEATLQKRYTAARIGTEAVRNQFGVNASEAEALVTRGIGVQQAAEGFQTAAQRRSFMGGPGETATREQLIGASFGDVASEQAIERIGGSRAGRFAEGGGFTTGQEGVAGLGSATR